MAEVGQALPASGTSAPAAASIPASSPSVSTNGTPPSGSPGQSTFNFGSLDPTKLPAEVQEAYKGMVADYTRKSQDLSAQQKEWESERKRYTEIENQFKTLKSQVDNYAKQEQVWKSWTPFLQRINQPGMIEKIQAVLDGQQAGAQQQPTTAQQTAQRLLQGIGDEDYITGTMLNQALGQLKEQWQAETDQRWQQRMQDYGQKAMNDMALWVQQYQTLVDQALTQRLMHQYGLTPKGDYDPQRVIDTAVKNNLPNLDLAYQLAYGQENAQRAVEAERARMAEELERAKQQAREEALREAAVQQQNAIPGMFPLEGRTMPSFTVKNAHTFPAAEEAARAALREKGFRP